MKRVEVQVGQIIEQLQGHQKGKLPSQPKQAMAIEIYQNNKEIDNGVKENLAHNIALHTETKGGDREEHKVDISVPTPSEIDQKRELVYHWSAPNLKPYFNKFLSIAASKGRSHKD